MPSRAQRSRALGRDFGFDNRFVMAGADLSDGKHEIEIKKKGKGAVYFNAYLTNFTLEDHITKAGLGHGTFQSTSPTPG